MHLATWAMAALLCGAASAAGQIELISDDSSADKPTVGLGSSGLYKLDYWTPIHVTIRAPQGIFTGYLGVRDRDIDGDRARYRVGPIYVDAQRGKTTDGRWIYARLANHNSGQLGRIELQLTDAAGAVVSSLSLPTAAMNMYCLPREQRIIAVCGPGGDLGLSQRVGWYNRIQFRQGESQTSLERCFVVAILSPQMLPDSWMGYDAVDTLILTAPDIQFVRERAQWTAIQEWVARGGHLIVSVAGLGQIAEADPETAAFLGVRIGPKQTVKPASPAAGQVFRDAAHTQIVPLTPAPDASHEADPQWMRAAGARIITRRPHGMGLVTCLGIDPATLMPEPRTNLFMQLARIEPEFSAVEPNQDPSTELEDMVQQFAGSSVGLAIPLILAYVGAAGPLHWWLTRRRRKKNGKTAAARRTGPHAGPGTTNPAMAIRPTPAAKQSSQAPPGPEANERLGLATRSAWLTFFIVGLAGAVVTYLFVTTLRGAEVEIYQVQVLDRAAGDSRILGTTWAGVNSTLDTTFDLEVDGGSGLVTAMPRRQDRQQQQYPVTSHYDVLVDRDTHHPAGDPATCKRAAIRNAVKCFEARWSRNAPEDDRIEANLRLENGNLTGTLKNNTKSDFGPGWLLVARPAPRKIYQPNSREQAVLTNVRSVEIDAYVTRPLTRGESLNAAALSRPASAEDLLRKLNAALHSGSDLQNPVSSSDTNRNPVRLADSSRFYRIVLAASLTHYYHCRAEYRYEQDYYYYGGPGPSQARYKTTQMAGLDLSAVLQPGRAVWIVPVERAEPEARIDPVGRDARQSTGPTVLRCSIPVWVIE